MNKKNKHSFEFKLSCVRQMDEHYRSAKSLGEEFGITYSLFETWYKIYKYQGESGLLPRKGERHFSASFKLSVLTAIREELSNILGALHKGQPFLLLLGKISDTTSPY
ncbi:helix-turn-helix domain-containing protein [Sphingobacterium anhuiense]|uniref:Helix-turn-helix domain-containing protein n=2 Tax=Sphingobacterium TaxID=28453 RepID=A0ABW5YYY4_9SPHI